MIEIKNRFTGEVVKTIDADNLIGANLSDANLSDADLSGADLRRADLRRADLRRADLIGANLSDADLSDAKNLPIVKKMETIKEDILKAIKESPTDGLNMDCWHACETTHCLAGWAVTLHPEGKLLESILNTNAAAALIFYASVGEVPNFYSTEEQAMEWLNSKTPNYSEAVEAT